MFNKNKDYKEYKVKDFMNGTPKIYMEIFKFLGYEINDEFLEKDFYSLIGKNTLEDEKDEKVRYFFRMLSNRLVSSGIEIFEDSETKKVIVKKGPEFDYTKNQVLFSLDKRDDVDLLKFHDVLLNLAKKDDNIVIPVVTEQIWFKEDLVGLKTTYDLNEEEVYDLKPHETLGFDKGQVEKLKKVPGVTIENGIIGSMAILEGRHKPVGTAIAGSTKIIPALRIKELDKEETKTMQKSEIKISDLVGGVIPGINGGSFGINLLKSRYNEIELNLILRELSKLGYLESDGILKGTNSKNVKKFDDCIVELLKLEDETIVNIFSKIYLSDIAGAATYVASPVKNFMTKYSNDIGEESLEQFLSDLTSRKVIDLVYNKNDKIAYSVNSSFEKRAKEIKDKPIARAYVDVDNQKFDQFIIDETTLRNPVKENRSIFDTHVPNVSSNNMNFGIEYPNSVNTEDASRNIDLTKNM